MQIYPLKLYFSLIKKFIMFSSLNIDIKNHLQFLFSSAGHLKHCSYFFHLRFSVQAFHQDNNCIKNVVSFLWFEGGGIHTDFVLSHTLGVKFSYCTLVYVFIHRCTFLYINVYLCTFC